MDPCTIVPIGSDADIITARQHGRAFLAQLGFSSPETTLVLTAIFEHDGRCGVMIIARDRGPGIPDDHRAAIDAGECAAGPLGLRATKRLMDEFQIMSAAGEGTTVALKKWKA